MTEKSKTGWQIACEWYSLEEIERCIHKAGMGMDNRERVPADIYSRDFAAWLTNQYRLAMAKGIQLGREQLSPVPDRETWEACVAALEAADNELWRLTDPETLPVHKQIRAALKMAGEA